MKYNFPLRFNNIFFKLTKNVNHLCIVTKYTVHFHGVVNVHLHPIIFDCKFRYFIHILPVYCCFASPAARAV